MSGQPATHRQQRSVSWTGSFERANTSSISSGAGRNHRSDIDDLVVLFSGQDARVTQFAVLNYNPSRDFDLPPPANSLRSPESVVSQGTIKVYKILEKKAAFLQCGNKFVHPILPKSRLWRTNVYEFILPQPIPGKFWRIELLEPETDKEGVCKALDKLETAFRTTCLYRNEYKPLPDLAEDLDVPLSPPLSWSNTPTPVSGERTRTRTARIDGKVDLDHGSKVTDTVNGIPRHPVSPQLGSTDRPVTPHRWFTAPIHLPGPPTSPQLANATTAMTMAVVTTPSPKRNMSHPSSATSTLDAILDTFVGEHDELSVDDVSGGDAYDGITVLGEPAFNEVANGNSTSQENIAGSIVYHHSSNDILDPSNVSVFTRDTDITRDSEFTSNTSEIAHDDTDTSSFVLHTQVSPAASPSTPYMCHPLIPFAQRNNILSSTYPLRFRSMDDDWLDVAYYGSPQASNYVPKANTSSSTWRSPYLTLASQITGDLFSSSSNYLSQKLRAPSIFNSRQQQQQSQAIDSLWPIYNSMTIGVRGEGSPFQHSPGNSVDSTESDLTYHVAAAASGFSSWTLLNKVGQWWRH